MQDPSVVVFPSPPGGPPEELIVFVVAILAVTAVLIFRPLVKAWARRLSGSDTAQIAELEQRVADLEQIGAGDLSTIQGELNELHERLDFTERMLAQGQRPQLAPESNVTDETTGIGS